MRSHRPSRGLTGKARGGENGSCSCCAGRRPPCLWGRARPLGSSAGSRAARPAAKRCAHRGSGAGVGAWAWGPASALQPQLCPLFSGCGACLLSECLSLRFHLVSEGTVSPGAAVRPSEITWDVHTQNECCSTTASGGPRPGAAPSSSAGAPHRRASRPSCSGSDPLCSPR